MTAPYTIASENQCFYKNGFLKTGHSSECNLFLINIFLNNGR